MERRFIACLAATLLFVPAALLSDGPGLMRQLALATATALLLWVIVRASPMDPWQVVIAIGVATIGEVVLSVVWGLYSYRHATIPLYVPVGHGVFYTLAAMSASQPALQQHASNITRAVFVCGTILGGLGLIAFGDVWGLLWWIAAAVLVRRSDNALLLSVCFIYTMLLEWLGTWLGNWAWEPVVPFVGLRSGNPPSGVGVLYIILDLVTITVWTVVSASRQHAPLMAATDE